MKVVYDRHTDTLVVLLRSDTPVAESDETSPGVILDLDAEGNVISLEVLDASQRVSGADHMEFRVDG